MTIFPAPARRAAACAVRFRRGALSATVLAATTAACGRTADSAPPAATVVDSAGIEIVTSSGPAWAAGEGWTVDETPQVEIGMMEGANEYLLAGVRGAKRRGDGTIVVANGQTGELRIFDGEGRHVVSGGGRGEGPGEFSFLTWIGLLPGDSIAAYDYMARRLSTFAPDGRFVRSVGLGIGEGGSIPQPVGMFPDQSLAVVMLDLTSGPGEGEVSRTPERLLRFRADGTLADTVAVLPGTEMFMESRESEGRRVVRFSAPLFARASANALVGDRAVVGSNDSYELQVLEPEGAVERIIRRTVQPRVVTEAMLAAGRRERSSGAATEEERTRQERALQDQPHGTTVPYYEAIMGDDDGNLWVKDYAVPGEAVPGWSVFGADGRLLGTVQLPRGLRPTHIGRDFVLGVVRDDMDVERVHLYSLEK